MASGTRRLPIPSPTGPVVLFRASLRRRARGAFALVRRRLVIAGLIALAASLARRLPRGRACSRGGSGGSSARPTGSRAATSASRSSIRGGDELGQLAAAFERMRQRLAQLEHARREFIANASHELRTPLFSLGGFLELMSDEELDADTQAEFLATMREQVDRLTKLATELLDLSRLDAGRYAPSSGSRRPRRAGRDPGGRVPRRRPLERATSSQSRARIRTEALGDEERALQIGRILVENALVHTPAGHRRPAPDGAARTARPCWRSRTRARGSRAEHAEQVFERFYRARGLGRVGERPRAGDRPRAGGADGRGDRAPVGGARTRTVFMRSSLPAAAAPTVAAFT